MTRQLHRARRLCIYLDARKHILAVAWRQNGGFVALPLIASGAGDTLGFSLNLQLMMRCCDFWTNKANDKSARERSSISGENFKGIQSLA
jgi:hypothetical protein